MAIYLALSGVVVLSTIDDAVVATAAAAETEIELLIELKLALKSIIDAKDPRPIQGYQSKPLV